jgi:hypothetical protein
MSVEAKEKVWMSKGACLGVAIAQKGDSHGAGNKKVARD